ncbi:MAG: hypothetical protein CMP23_03865 [Rickettsiales bacterium]|nr:hypothetical protein [Rickettsiales bacterium]
MRPAQPRADGATRSDWVEAAALVAGGMVLLAVPVLTMLDPSERAWQLFSLVLGLPGLAIVGYGLRWFLREGPELESVLATSHTELMSLPAPKLPIELALKEAGQRIVAHSLRMVAFGCAALLMLANPGPLRWLVIALCGTSFIADQWLLRSRSYRFSEEGLNRPAAVSSLTLPWDQIEMVFWRHYPGPEQPVFPSGERIIIASRQFRALEFVFRGPSAREEAAALCRVLVKRLDTKVRILRPRPQREPVVNQQVSQRLDPASAGATADQVDSLAPVNSTAQG